MLKIFTINIFVFTLAHAVKVSLPTHLFNSNVLLLNQNELLISDFQVQVLSMIPKIATFDFMDYFVLPVPFVEIVNDNLSVALHFPKMIGKFSSRLLMWRLN